MTTGREGMEVITEFRWMVFPVSLKMQLSTLILSMFKWDKQQRAVDFIVYGVELMSAAKRYVVYSEVKDSKGNLA